MSTLVIGVFVSAITLAPAVHAAQAPANSQPSRATAPQPTGTPAAITMTGCISSKPGAAGQYTFADADGISEYRLNGKEVKKFAGQRVELVGGSSGKGLTVRGGLWPASAGGARGVAQDPAQESVSRHAPGAGTRGEFPEFQVTRLRAVQGVCQ